MSLGEIDVCRRVLILFWVITSVLIAITIGCAVFVFRCVREFNGTTVRRIADVLTLPHACARDPSTAHHGSTFLLFLPARRLK